jgi:hypothetical protein
MSIFEQVVLKLAELLVEKKKLVAVGKVVPMPGKLICAVKQIP